MHKSFKKEGEWVKVPVKTKAYPLATIYAATYALMDKAYFYLDTEAAGTIAVWLRSKKKGVKPEALAPILCEELLNYAHYFSSLKINAESVKALLQRALFSAAPSLVQEAEEKEIQDLIKELEEEEVKETKRKK